MFRRLRAGDTLDGNISARAYNQMLDLIEQISSTKVGSTYNSRFSSPVQMLQVENTIGDLLQTNIVKLTSPFFDPAVDLEKFQLNSVLKIATPSGRGNFGVAPAALPNNEVGPIIVAGTCPVKIDVVHASHTHADLIPTDQTKLRSGFAGHARILWKESGTGVKNALIQFPVADQGTLLGKPNATIAPGTSGTVTIWINGAATTATETGHLVWMHGGEQVSANKQVELTWVPVEGKWIITGAECES